MICLFHLVSSRNCNLSVPELETNCQHKAMKCFVAAVVRWEMRNRLTFIAHQEGDVPRGSMWIHSCTCGIYYHILPYHVVSCGTVLYHVVRVVIFCLLKLVLNCCAYLQGDPLRGGLWHHRQAWSHWEHHGGFCGWATRRVKDAVTLGFVKGIICEVSQVSATHCWVQSRQTSFQLVLQHEKSKACCEAVYVLPWYCTMWMKCNVLTVVSVPA